MNLWSKGYIFKHNICLRLCFYRDVIINKDILLIVRLLHFFTFLIKKGFSDSKYLYNTKSKIMNIMMVHRSCDIWFIIYDWNSNLAYILPSRSPKVSNFPRCWRRRSICGLAEFIKLGLSKVFNLGWPSRDTPGA